MSRPDLGKVAWITGAGRGIGRALAKRLAHDGWTVAVSGRTASELASLADECPATTVHCFQLNVVDAEATRVTVIQMEETLGPLDLVVLNAGTHKPETANKFRADTVRQLVETNLIGVANGLEHIIPIFAKRNRGHLAIVSSLAGYRGLPTAAAYGASKAGLINMCEALKPELDRMGVRLTLINPGFVETPLTARNDFPMPFLISAESAVDAILEGLESNKFEVSFPWRFALIMKLLRVMPDKLFFFITKRMIRS